MCLMRVCGHPGQAELPIWFVFGSPGLAQNRISDTTWGQQMQNNRVCTIRQDVRLDAARR